MIALALNKQALEAQAACLRAKGYPEDAANVERGLVEFDPEALELLEPREAAEALAGNCPACWHLWRLHGPRGCSAKVYPAHSLTGEPCPCEQSAPSEG